MDLRLVPLLIFLCACAAPFRQSAPPPPSSVWVKDSRLQALLQNAVDATLSAHAAKGFTQDNLAVSLVDLTTDPNGQWAGIRDSERLYPASVVKLFYLAAAFRWIEDGRLQMTPELERALRDMVVDSSDDATSYVVDVLTGTTSGPELSDAEMAEWSHKRREVQRYFEAAGYPDINVTQKTWAEGPYGRERAFYGPERTNRNMLTTRSVAQLLRDIVQGRAATPAHTETMRRWLQRDPTVVSDDHLYNQATAFSAVGLPAGSKLWSKAGWISRARHDAAYVELPSGRRFVVVVFTEGKPFATDREIIGGLVRNIVRSWEYSER